jgi:phthiodiolone/phenolphthiodiolone dimycocerosates ketoreductase
MAFVVGDRHLSAAAVPKAAKLLNDSGVVDFVAFSHQLGSFLPAQLWRPEVTPSAELMGDPDSLDDAFLLAAYAASSAPDSRLSVLTDSIRMGPGHMIQMMMTLAHITEGRSLINFGAGEIKQADPFGWPRKQGIKRLEDLLNLFSLFWDSDGPVSYDGHHWTFDRAFLGGAKTFRPRIHTMGGGPRIMGLAAEFCDGFSTAIPCAWPTADHAAEKIATLKDEVAARDRDPDDFDILVTAPALIHEDEAVLAKAMENPAIRWIAAMWGRIQPGASWEESGLAPPVPEGWAYHMHYRPHDTDDSFLEDVLRKTTPDHVDAGYLCGTPAQVAAKLQAYVDAGATIVAPFDLLPFALGPGDGRQSTRRVIETLGHVKE